MKTPPGLIPAAHSMDTVWFAVDEEGHVGVFDTNEGGAMPSEARNDEQGDQRIFELEARRYARLAAVPGAALTALSPPRAGAPAQRVVVVGAGPAVESALGPFSPQVLREASPRVWVTGLPVPGEVQARLRADPQVQAVLDEEQVIEWAWESDVDQDDGVFHFSATSDYGSPGAYERVRVLPAEPLHVSALSARVQAEVGAVVLPVKFGATETVQLADHFTQDEVITWGDVPLRGLGAQSEEAPVKPALVRPAAPPTSASSLGSWPLVWGALGLAALVAWVLLSKR